MFFKKNQLSLYATYMCFSTACLPISKAGGHASFKNGLH